MKPIILFLLLLSFSLAAKISPTKRIIKKSIKASKAISQDQLGDYVYAKVTNKFLQHYFKQALTTAKDQHIQLEEELSSAIHKKYNIKFQVEKFIVDDSKST